MWPWIYKITRTWIGYGFFRKVHFRFLKFGPGKSTFFPYKWITENFTAENKFQVRFAYPEISLLTVTFHVKATLQSSWFLASCQTFSHLGTFYSSGEAYHLTSLTYLFSVWTQRFESSFLKLSKVTFELSSLMHQIFNALDKKLMQLSYIRAYSSMN